MKCHQAAFDDFCQDPIADAATVALYTDHRDQFNVKAKDITRQVGLYFRKLVFEFSRPLQHAM
jgi:hypothetical protein